MNRTGYSHLIGALILLTLAIVLYGWWYTIVGAKSAEVVQIQQQLSDTTQDSVQTAKAKAEIASLSNDESTLDQYFVSTTNVVPFLQQIQTTGKYLGSDVEVVSVAATPGTPYGELDLSLSITGSFDSVLRTIGAIEYEPYDTQTSSLTFNSGSSSGAAASSPEWTANATFLIGTQVAAPLVAPSPAATQIVQPSQTPTALASTSAYSATATPTTITPTIAP